MNLSFLRFYIVIILFSFASIAYSQENNSQDMLPCGYDDYVLTLKDNPSYQNKISKFTQQYLEFMQNQTANTIDPSKSSMVYTIPVVVHIIHAGDPLGTENNPTDVSIATDINRTSLRFRHMQFGAGSYNNPFYGADTEIELCLASEDPNGNYTTGVIRHEDPANVNNPPYSYLGGLCWDETKYINMFIIEEINAAGRYVWTPDYEFTQYKSSIFWSGLIAHEVGHQFTLAHTFTPNGGCNNNDCLVEGDGVCDTPPKFESGFTYAPPPNDSDACNFPGNECTTDADDTSTNNPYRPTNMGGMGDQPDHLENYMDYTGSCWDCFTQGQKTRMRFNIDNDRVALKNNGLVCSSIPTPANDSGISSINVFQNDECGAIANLEVEMSNYGTETLTNATINVFLNSTFIFSEIWSGSIPSGQSTTYNLSTELPLLVGNNLLKIATSLPNNNTDANSHSDADFRTVNYVYSLNETTDTAESCEPLEWFDLILDATGIYTYTALNQYGCDSLVEMNFTYIGFDNSIYQDGNILLTNEMNVDYQWADCNGNPIPGATNASFEPETSGSYNVELSNGNCTTTSDCIDFIISNTNQIGTTPFKYYPNPTADLVQIDFKSSINQLSIACYDIHGQLILEQNFQNHQLITLSLQDYPSGLYLIQLVSEEFSESIKLMKKEK